MYKTFRGRPYVIQLYGLYCVDNTKSGSETSVNQLCICEGCSRCSLETAGYERRDSITGCGEERAAKDYKYILKEWIALRVRSDLLLKLWIFLCYSPPSNSRGIGARKFRNCYMNG